MGFVSTHRQVFNNGDDCPIHGPPADWRKLNLKTARLETDPW
jgi:hypothetical protein